MTRSQHSELKAQFPGIIILLIVGDCVVTHDADANTLHDLLGVDIIRNRDCISAGFPVALLDEYIGSLIMAGKTAMVETAKG